MLTALLLTFATLTATAQEPEAEPMPSFTQIGIGIVRNDNGIPYYTQFTAGREADEGKMPCLSHRLAAKYEKGGKHEEKK